MAKNILGIRFIRSFGRVWDVAEKRDGGVSAPSSITNDARQKRILDALTQNRGQNLISINWRESRVIVQFTSF